VSNCVPVPQLGAISTKQGHHWIIENNLVRQVNGVGVDYGRRQTFIPYEVPADTPKLAGVGTIVRRNAFEQCGACSLSGLGLIGGLVEDNYSTACGWRRVGGLAESAGIKVHYMKHSLVRRNAVRGTVAAAGLWVDHSNHNARVTRNIVVGAEGPAFFLEATYGPTLIDHNILWDCKGSGFLLTESSNATIANNLVGNCTGQPVRIAPASRRMLDLETSRMATAEHNRVVGNVFFGFGDRGVGIPVGKANVSDYNIFVNPPDAAKPFDLAAWRQRTGQETHSLACAAQMELALQTWTLRQTPLLPVVQMPRIHAVTSDYFGAPWDAGDTTPAGPFLPANVRPEMVLFKPLVR
jgi:parallel beta-helix repeat protein